MAYLFSFSQKLFDLESNTRHHIVDFCHDHVFDIVIYIFKRFCRSIVIIELQYCFETVPLECKEYLNILSLNKLLQQAISKNR